MSTPMQTPLGSVIRSQLHFTEFVYCNLIQTFQQQVKALLPDILARQDDPVIKRAVNQIDNILRPRVDKSLVIPLPPPGSLRDYFGPEHNRYRQNPLKVLIELSHNPRCKVVAAVFRTKKGFRCDEHPLIWNEVDFTALDGAMSELAGELGVALGK